MASIAGFFAGQSVFLTGISGFLGKVLVEKLLRSCPNVKAIYVLIREKKGTPAPERLHSILAEKLFEHLQQNDPLCFNKVKFVSGDLLKNEIILRNEDLEMLREKINIVIHSAASVLEFATTVKNLKSFVHVSTAYSNCHMCEVDEKVYPCDVEPRQVMSLCDWMADDLLEHLCPKLLKERPNTYTFTKALAENLVAEYSDKIPVAIVRPSIITGAATEPFPGWVDNYNGPNGLLIALGTGVLTTLYTQLDCVADLIPVDFVANTVLAAAHRTSNGFRVYNCTSGTQNAIKWREFMEQSIDFPHQYPTTSIVRYPHPRITSNKLLHQARLFLEHYVPAHMIDAILRCAGKKPVLSRLYERLANSMGLLEFFATNEWRFHNDNTRQLFNDLSETDQKEFNFNVYTIDWASYVHNYCLGIRQFILKEDIGNLDQAKRHLNRMKYINYVTNAVLVVGAWKAFCSVIPCSEMTGLC
ncbi:fatty acyl-CoA reductase 1-like isoform X2 [Varroa jacobsoni]|uniref:fatty acyl-CoA reductase 1-like isoform X2 n=1 Tax=Varroa jacobsoni TaxID=62625 RepID=UPI000BF2810F|nr:fatty acyl-CoA reductase 1-like isoform X2 [Varroa jacobsoni]